MTIPTDAVHVTWKDEPPADMPDSARYSTVAHFRHAGAQAKGHWSVVIDIQGDPRARPCRATARFLVPDAPHAWMRPGVEFELLEGRRVRATVRVL